MWTCFRLGDSAMNWRITKYLLLLVVIIFLYWLAPGFRYYPDASVERIKLQLAENVPLGSSRESLYSYLSARQFEYPSDNRRSMTVNAIKRDVCITAMLRCDVQVVIELDDQDLVREYRVREILTGL